MIEIKKLAAQGDLLVRRVAKLPEGLKESPTAPSYTVAHSETGHHHVATGASGHYTTEDGMLSYLVATGPIDVVHHRSFDTHEPLRLLDGEGEGEVVWEIRRQREHTPEGWRRIED